MSATIGEDSIVWTDDFLIGIDELDYEHRVLIEDINKLHTEMDAEVDPARINDTLGSIFARLQAHFALEEHVMTERGYVHFDEHKAEHDMLIDLYIESMLKFRRTPTPEGRQALETVLRRWIVNHIRDSDKKMSAMIAKPPA